MDFTEAKYKELLLAVSTAGIPVFGIRDWMVQRPDRGVFIRHDVDRIPGNSLRIARLEYELGLSTTYYFRIVPASFDPKIIREIASLGHEIGYHYEDLSLAGGDYDKAYVLFGEHLEKLRTMAEIKTAAMHGRPLSKYDNRDLWKNRSVEDFGLIGEAFLDIDYTNVYYFTDTGRNWVMDRNNLRDKTVSRTVTETVESTDDLIAFFRKNADQTFALITHPERWNAHRLKWALSYSMDRSVNVVKSILKTLRPS